MLSLRSSFHPLLLLGLASAVSAQAPGPIKDPRAAALKLPAQPSVDDGHPVRVQSEKGAPIAGASVLVVDYQKLGRKARRETLQEARKRFAKDTESGVLLMAAKHGRRYVTNESGEARFARIERGLVVAVSGSMLTQTTVRLRAGRDPRLLTMQLRAVPGVDVLVVDSRGKPVKGVPVDVRYRGRTFDYGYWAAGNQQARTNARGWVRLKPLRKNSSYDSIVALRIPQRPVVGVTVDPKTFKNNPEQPIKLTMPEFGSVRVMVEDTERRPVKKLNQVYMHLREGNRRESIPATTVDVGFATFDFVPVGLEFEITCSVGGHSRPQRITGSGPRHPRDMRILRLGDVSEAPVLTFRVLDQDGKALGRETLGVILAAENSTQTTTVKLNAKGEGKLTLSETFASAEQGLLTMVRRNTSREKFYLGAIQLELETANKKLTLGDLKLQKEPLMVRGRAVDAAGKPIAGIELSMPHGYYLSSTRHSHFQSTSSSRYRYHQHTVRTDQDGKFEFRQIGEPPADFKITIAPQAKAPNYAIVEGEEPEVGAKEHTVVLVETGQIHGSVTGLPKTIQYFGTIKVLAAGETESAGQLSRDQDGSFKVSRCKPGTYSVSFTAPRGKEPFLVVENLKIESGKTCSDPRLQNIDVGKHCTFIKVKVLDPSGKPLAGASYSVITRKERGYSSFGSSAGDDGTFVVAKTDQPLDLSVEDSRRRYRQVRIEDIKKDLTVTMKPGWTVHLAVVGLPKLHPKITYSVRLTPQRNGGKSWPSSYYRRDRLGSKGTMSLGVTNEGEFTVRLSPTVRDSEVDVELPKLTGSFKIAEGQATDKPIKLAIKLTPEDLDLIKAAIDDLKAADKQK